MYINFAIIHIAEDKRAAFETRSRRPDNPVFEAPGFLKVNLMRDNDNPGRYFYTSIWESFEHIEAYRESQAVLDMKRDAAVSNTFVGPRDQVSCELIFEADKTYPTHAASGA
jgi:heme-degrading monooxygenase HmoA